MTYNPNDCNQIGMADKGMIFNAPSALAADIESMQAELEKAQLFEGLKVTKAMVIRIAMTKGLAQMQRELAKSKGE